MDTNDLRVIVMLIGFVLFAGICIWAWSSRRKKAFDEAARLPFLDDETGRKANGEKQ